MEEEDDLVLVERWRAGDREAGTALYDRHYQAVYRLFQHKIESDAADLVQETFLACQRGLAGFRGTGSFRAYLLGIARHTLHHYWRRRRVRGEVLDFDEISIASLSTSAGTRIGRRQDHARLLEALRELPLDQQLILEVHYWRGFGSELLAVMFEIEPATARSRLFRARQALRERLEKVRNDPPDGGTSRP